MPIEMPERTIFFASLRDISERKALEEEIDQQARLTMSILNSMADAVVVVDRAERLVMVNPAGQRLLNLTAAGNQRRSTLGLFRWYQPDGKTHYPYEQRPLPRALRGEHVNGLVARIRHADFPQASGSAPMPGRCRTARASWSVR